MDVNKAQHKLILQKRTEKNRKEQFDYWGLYSSNNDHATIYCEVLKEYLVISCIPFFRQ